MSFYSFYATLHARPPILGPAVVRSVGEREVAVLDVPQAELGRGFERTFEQVADVIGRFERMFFEPDGSFVWVASANEINWQLDGVLYDRNGRVIYVDLKGNCPAARLDQFLTALGWPETPVMFQLVREAVFLDEAEFRRLASASAAPR